MAESTKFKYVNFNAKRDLRVHKKDHKKKAENLVDLIDGAEFIFDDDEI